MILDDKTIRLLGNLYFDGRMPIKLRLYLVDTYGYSQEPRWGKFDKESFWVSVISDIEKYLDDQLDVTIRTEESRCRLRDDELSKMAAELAAENCSLQQENKLLNDFISWVHLEDLLDDFIANVYKKTDGNGFQRYVVQFQQDFD